MVKFITGLADRLVAGLVPQISAAASSNDCFFQNRCVAPGPCLAIGGANLFAYQCCVDASGTFCSGTPDHWVDCC